MSNEVSPEMVQMAKNYIAITTEMGPSEQLLAFINYDNKLEDEIGLEGFNTMSLQTRHEVLLSKLTNLVDDNIATEGFSEFVQKYKGWLTVSGIAGTLVFGGILWTGLLVAGVTGIALVKVKNQVLSFAGVKEEMLRIDEGIKNLKELISKLPSSDDAEGWKTFKTNLDTESNRLSDSLDEAGGALVTVSKSDWTPAGLLGAIKWHEKKSKEVADIEKSFANAIVTLNSKDPATAKTVNQGLEEAFSSIKYIQMLMKVLGNDINKVAKCYAVKAED